MTSDKRIASTLHVQGGQRAINTLLQHLNRLRASMRKLPTNAAAHQARIWAACNLSLTGEQIRDEKRSPIAPLLKAIDLVTSVFQATSKTFAPSDFHRYVDRSEMSSRRTKTGSLEQQTASLYSHLFGAFDHKTYYDETIQLLSDRFRLNNVPMEWIKGKVCLDDGCGGGRYTVALARLGAKHVTGLDLSANNIKDAKRRLSAGGRGLSKVTFINGSVLDLPFANDSFDFVFSNGVLHHSKNPEKGMREIYRVLKPAGKLWFYINDDSGFQTILFHLMRDLLSSVPKEVTTEFMKQFGFDVRRRFYFMDIWYAPFNEEYNATQVEAMMKRNGFSQIRRLMRDVERPHYMEVNEMLSRHIRHAAFWYGAGQHR